VTHGTTDDFEVVPAGTREEMERLRERIDILEGRLEFSNALKDYWRYVAERKGEEFAKVIANTPVQFRG